MSLIPAEGPSAATETSGATPASAPPPRLLQQLLAEAGVQVSDPARYTAAVDQVVSGAYRRTEHPAKLTSEVFKTSEVNGADQTETTTQEEREATVSPIPEALPPDAVEEALPDSTLPEQLNGSASGSVTASAATAGGNELPEIAHSTATQGFTPSATVRGSAPSPRPAPSTGDDESDRLFVSALTSGRDKLAKGGGSKGGGSKGGGSPVLRSSLLNNPPFAGNDSYSILHDQALTVAAPGVMQNDFDFDGDPLTAILVGDVSNGTLSFNSDGSFTYTPDAGFAGTDSFTYKANDGLADSNTATVTIDVTNALPFAGDDSYGVLHDQTLAVSAPGVMQNDFDMDSDPLTASLVSGVSNGTLGFNSDGSFTYTPNTGFAGTDSFTYKVNDGLVDSHTATVTLNVTNSPPFAGDDPFSISHNQTLSVDATNGPGLLGNDFDMDGDPLTATVVSTPTHGTLMQFSPDGSFVYLPAWNFTGTDSFTYKVNDGIADSNTATVTINVTNSPPFANNDAYGVHPGVPITVNAPGVLGNDMDGDEDSLSAVLVNGPVDGTLTLNADGSFTYTPDTSFVGSDSFTYKANDGLVDSSVATVTLNVHATNLSPSASGDSYSIDHNQTLTVVPSGVLGNDTDPENDPLTAVLVSGPANGTLSLSADGSFTYTPNTNFRGTDSFTYKANDGLADSGTATVTITVTNEAPSAGDDLYATGHDEVLTVSAPGVLGNDFDFDGDSLTAVLVSGVSNGTLALAADGSFTYTPAANFAGTDSFTYKANDGMDDSNVATVTISVINAAPVGASDFFDTPQGQALTVNVPGVLGNDYDDDGDPLTASLVNGPVNGTLNLSAGGNFTYTPNVGFTGNDTFTYQPHDGIAYGNVATVTVSVTGNLPIANGDEFAMAMDETLTVPAVGVLVNDVSHNGDPLSAVLESGPANGGVALASDGSFVYTPNAGFSGADSFTYKASASGLLSLQAAIVFIHVVKIDLGVGGDGFVPINANNDNGSAVKNEVPVRRDFDMNPLRTPAGAAVNDPDLVTAGVTINPNAGLPGFFILSVVNNGTGRIKLWNNQNKGAPVVEGVYTLATLPREFFVEGTEPSAALGENTITLQYFYINPFGILTAAARDDFEVTVTPVIDFFTIQTGNVVFRQILGLGNVGLDAKGANPGVEGGVFSAQLTRKFLGGNAEFVQNFRNVLNGVRGAAAGYVFAPAAGQPAIPNRNMVPTPVWDRPPGAPRPVAWPVEIGPGNVYRVVRPRGAPAAVAPAFPILDMALTQLPMPADYKGFFFRLNPNANTQLINAMDGPGTLVPRWPANTLPVGLRGRLQHARLTDIDLEFQFRLYLVWKFTDGTRYTLATRDWSVVFRATGPAAGGLNAIDKRSVVSAPGGNNFNRTHANPVVTRPTFNFTIQIV